MFVQVRRAQERAERREEKRGSKHFMKDMTFSIKSQAKASNLNKVGWTVLEEIEEEQILTVWKALPTVAQLGNFAPKSFFVSKFWLNHTSKCVTKPKIKSPAFFNVICWSINVVVH